MISGAYFNFNVTLMDKFGQRLTFDYLSRSKFSRKINSSAVFSREKFDFNSGLHQYKSVKIKYQPNSDLDFNMEVSFFEEEFLPFISERHPDNNLNEEIQTFVRLCVTGELFIIGDLSCYLCQPGDYSIDDPQAMDAATQNCRSCPSDAICPGGNEIIPKKGFWRAHQNTTLIIACSSQSSCLGHDDFESLTESESNFFCIIKTFFFLNLRKLMFNY